jgi:cytochrome c-type biogenesis protein CcmH/NrfG
VSAEVSRQVAQANELVTARKVPQATRLLAQVLAMDPDNADALGLLAQARLIEGDWAAAVDLSARALASDPSSGWLHRLQAIGLQHCGRLDEAVTAIERDLQLEPDQSDPFTRAGRIYAEKRRFPDAWAAINRAVELDPNSPHVHLSAGYVAMEAQDWATARAALARALAIDPTNVEGQENLAVIDLRQGKGGRAASGLVQVLAANPASSTARYNLDVVAWHHLNKVGWVPTVLLLVWGRFSLAAEDGLLVAARIGIVAVVAAAALVLGLAARRLPPGYRHAVVGLLHADGWYRAGAAMIVGCGALFLLGSVVPGRTPFVVCVLIAAFLGVASRLTSYYGLVRWQRRQP